MMPAADTTGDPARQPSDPESAAAVERIAALTDRIEATERELRELHRKRRTEITDYLTDVTHPERHAGDLVRAVGRSTTQIKRIATGESSGRKNPSPRLHRT
jgi:hypothetical protein